MEARLTVVPPHQVQQHPMVAAAENLFVVIMAAELRGLPLPFVTRGYDYDTHIELQFHSRDEVATWAEAMGADLVADDLSAVASGVWLDVPLRVSVWAARDAGVSA